MSNPVIHVIEGIKPQYYGCSCGYCPINYKDRTTNKKKLEKHLKRFNKE